MHQTSEAKADAREITKYITSFRKRVGYAHYIAVVQLSSVPYDWSPERVGNALVDAVDGGWSPFGGHATLIDAANLIWKVKVYTD